jgi:integrase
MPKVERLPSGSYRIRYTDPWGRRAVITRKTAADVRAAHRQIVSAMARGEYVDPRRGRTTVGEWAEDWLTGARNLSPNGRKIYEQALDHILPELGKVPLGKLSATDVDRYLSKKLETLAPSTCHRHYRALHRMLAIAVDRGLIPRNVCDKIQPPRVPAKDMTVLNVDQIDALADAITPRYRAWVYTSAYAGLRWSESVGLRRRHVDGPRVAVVDQLLRIDGEWRRTETKSRNRRTVTLPSFAADELKVHVETFSNPGDDGLVFCTRSGGPLYGGSWNGVFKRALARAGLPPIRPHDLRHSSASLALAAGGSVKDVQARLGHSSARVTLDIYAHLLPGADEAVAAGLEDLRAKAQRARLRAV